MTKACSILIKNKESLILDTKDILLINQMLGRHISLRHDLEVLWLLYLLIETENIKIDDPIIQKVINSENELADIILLRKGLLTKENVVRVVDKAKSWILLYELYASNYIEEAIFKLKLNINKNTAMYQYFHHNNIHFCEI